jgi:hypothetical protein
MDWTNKLKNNYVRWAISSETNEIHDDTDFDLRNGLERVDRDYPEAGLNTTRCSPVLTN